MDGRREHLRIPATLDRVADARALIRAFAERCRAPEVCEEDLVQAVDEIATNTIIHGYRGSPGWLDVTAERVGDRIVVTIEDEAPLFDPTTVPPPDLDIAPEHRRPGGMGVHLTRLASESMQHEARPGGGNILTITRRVHDGD
jgi:serine/threonine-protein kinase RsbW